MAPDHSSTQSCSWEECCNKSVGHSSLPFSHLAVSPTGSGSEIIELEECCNTSVGHSSSPFHQLAVSPTCRWSENIEYDDSFLLDYTIYIYMLLHEPDLRHQPFDCHFGSRHSLLANLGTRVRPSQVGHALAGPGTRGGCPPPGIPGRAKDRREAREREGALFSSHP